jgi:hypothetical protein
MESPLAQIRYLNDCEVQRFEEYGTAANANSKAFQKHVLSIQSILVHMWQVTAALAIGEKEPADAARLWKDYLEWCDRALNALRKCKDRFPDAGADDLYDLALDYRNQAQSRYQNNIQDAEWQKKAQSDILLQSLIGQS